MTLPGEEMRRPAEGRPEEVSPVSEPHVPRPMPLPVSAPPRARNRTVVGIVAAVLVVCSCCCLSQVLLPALFIGAFGDRFEQAFESPAVTRAMQPNEVAWAGGGDYAAIQSCDESGVPRVVVWERATGRTRKLERHRLIAAEEASAGIWTALDAAAEDESDPFLQQVPAGSFDGEARGLGRVSLTEAVLEPSLVASAWAAWRGPNGSTVRLGVLRNRSSADVGLAFPSFVTVERPGKPAWQVPSETGKSYRPLGWSPSGRYFALHSLARPDNEDYSSQIILLDTETSKSRVGAEVFEYAWFGGGVPIVWDGREDRLWWFEANPEDDTAEEYDPSLVTIRTEGERELVPVPGDGDVGLLAGGHPEGVLVVGTQDGPVRSWVTTEGGVRALGKRPAPRAFDEAPSAVRLSARGEMLFVTVRPDQAGGFVKEVRVSGTDFRGERVIWRERVVNPLFRAIGLGPSKR